MQRKRIAEANKGIGKPSVGGPFNLVDQNGDVFTDADLKGRYSLVSSLGTLFSPPWCFPSFPLWLVF
jgi:hypothetical protein